MKPVTEWSLLSISENKVLSFKYPAIKMDSLYFTIEQYQSPHLFILLLDVMRYRWLPAPELALLNNLYKWLHRKPTTNKRSTKRFAYEFMLTIKYKYILVYASNTKARDGERLTTSATSPARWRLRLGSILKISLCKKNRQLIGKLAQQL